MEASETAAHTRILADVAAALTQPRYLLAISGGVDSMVLLDAASAVAPPETLTVATFDHATGPAATAAARLVQERAEALHIPVIVGRAPTPSRTEAEWRRQRWHFLSTVASEARATIVTAHTLDDQIETVFMRILRDAGPRGIAALYAGSPIVRPLLTIPRATILEYAREKDVTFVTDPSNFDRRHLRNRVRHDLLPAIRGVRPDFEGELLDLAQKSAVWRAQMDQIAATFTGMTEAGAYSIPRAQFAGYSPEALRALWPAIAARRGIVMDWRGTHRLSLFTIEGETGQSIQLSGGVEVLMRRDAIVFRRLEGHV